MSEQPPPLPTRVSRQAGSSGIGTHRGLGWPGEQHGGYYRTMHGCGGSRAADGVGPRRGMSRRRRGGGCGWGDCGRGRGNDRESRAVWDKYDGIIGSAGPARLGTVTLGRSHDEGVQNPLASNQIKPKPTGFCQSRVGSRPRGVLRSSRLDGMRPIIDSQIE